MSNELDIQTAIVETESTDADVTTDSLSRRLPSTDPSTTEQVQAFGVRIRHYLDKLPKQIKEVFEIYQKPLTALAIIIGVALGIAIADGVLNVLNAIPLVMPLLELIGLGYLGWFSWRYLRYAETRQELIREYRHIKSRIIGDATVHLESE